MADQQQWNDDDRDIRNFLGMAAIALWGVVIVPVLTVENYNRSVAIALSIFAGLLTIGFFSWRSIKGSIGQGAYRQSLLRLASDARIHFAIVGFLALYFSAFALVERYRAAPVLTTETENVSSGWPLPSKTAIADLADDLRPYQPDYAVIIYDDAQEVPLVLAFAKAMSVANWKPPGMVGQLENPRLGIQIFVGSDLTGALEPLKQFCRKQLKTEPTILTTMPGMSSKSVQIIIGHNETD